MIPQLEQRPAQPAVAIQAEVTHETLGSVVPPLFAEVFGWLAERGIAPTGPPFIRYLFVDEQDDLPTRLEVGAPVAGEIPGDDRVAAITLPAGCYAVTQHVGPYAGLHAATEILLEWGRDAGVVWARSADGNTWSARLEIYRNDPQSQPDPQLLRTELAFLTRQAHG